MTVKALPIFLIICELYTIGPVSAGCANEARCTITRAHRMKAADCFERKFTQFPKCIPTDVEVLELTSNKITKIDRSDLSPFGYLQFLYLQDNKFTEINDEVFKDMGNLRTLDLSQNVIRKLPATIFQLPSLTTLYLSQNTDMNLVDSLRSAKPIASPLEKVDISFTTDKCNIIEFPDFGPVPFLALLNITGNQYVTMTRQNFMGFCNLQILVNDNVTTGFHVPCDCVRINQWLTLLQVKFTPFVCSVTDTDCPHMPYRKEELEVLNQCGEIVETLRKEYKMWKIYVGLGVVAAILVLCGLVYCLVCRKKCGKRLVPANTNESKKPPDNLGLLNNPLLLILSSRSTPLVFIAF